MRHHGRMAAKLLDEQRAELESMAVTTLLEVMGNTQYEAGVRLVAAEKALRALGKAEPVKSTSPQVVFNFGDHLSKALLGIGKTFELMEPAQDQETLHGKV